MKWHGAVWFALVGLLTTSAHGQIRFDWTAAEKACATSIGVDLATPAQPQSASHIRHLTWIADLIVFGRVVEVTCDIEGDYHTILKIDVTLVKKGQPDATPLHVMLLSGPVYYRPLNIMATTELVGEPEFQEGESVLLFLTKGRDHIPGDPAAFALAPGEYNLVNRTKFIVQQGNVRLAGTPTSEYQLSWVNAEIELARSTQQGGCQ